MERIRLYSVFHCSYQNLTNKTKIHTSDLKLNITWYCLSFCSLLMNKIIVTTYYYLPYYLSFMYKQKKYSFHHWVLFFHCLTLRLKSHWRQAFRFSLWVVKKAQLWASLQSRLDLFPFFCHPHSWFSSPLFQYVLISN